MEGNRYISIAAYLNVNGIKIYNPETKKQEIHSLQLTPRDKEILEQMEYLNSERFSKLGITKEQDGSR